tara:strand:- start:1 stop:759 length:759 start_codon:yes stop_codon:yes gene_type:complete
LIKSKKLLKIKNIKHGFLNKTGGKSKKIYTSLNCGPGSKDDPSNVKKNLKIAIKKICKNSKNVFLLQQIHSNKFVYINQKKKFRSKPKADAVITDQRNLPIGILTADCVPILICDKRINLIAAIHAGWRGAYKNIIDKVINFMIKRGSNPKDITAAIGPAISVLNYEVKKDFKRKFIKKDKKNNRFFKIKCEKLYFNLPNYVKSCLLKNKIKNIEKINIDTFDKKNNFFSARRSLKLNHDDYGRNISIIMLN